MCIVNYRVSCYFFITSHYISERVTGITCAQTVTSRHTGLLDFILLLVYNLQEGQTLDDRQTTLYRIHGRKYKINFPVRPDK